MFTTRFEAWVRRHAEAFVSALGRSPLTPNQVTVVGVALTFVASGLIAFGYLRWAGLVLILAGTCDILDGALARSTNAAYPYGAFLDSTLDRIEEGIVLTAVAAVFAADGDELAAAATVAAVLASLMVSYTRARAEALGVECKVGIASRAVRVVILSIGILFADLGLLAPSVYVLAGLGTITVLQRIFHVRSELRADGHTA